MTMLMQLLLQLAWTKPTARQLPEKATRMQQQPPPTLVQTRHRKLREMQPLRQRTLMLMQRLLAKPQVTLPLPVRATLTPLSQRQRRRAMATQQPQMQQ